MDTPKLDSKTIDDEITIAFGRGYYDKSEVETVFENLRKEGFVFNRFTDSYAEWVGERLYVSGERFGNALLDIRLHFFPKTEESIEIPVEEVNVEVQVAQ